MVGDDRTFRVNFTSDGAVRLRERVNEKLREFMGEYTDDTLVEYVIVLLKNGRGKDEAKSELNVFLGDDSESFVSWLWDHLGSHLSSYVQERGLNLVGVPKSKSAAEDGRSESKQIETVAEEENRTPRKHPNHKHEGLVTGGIENENPVIQSSIVDNLNDQDGTCERARQRKSSTSPWPKIEKKRRRHDDRWPMKSEVSKKTVCAPRRLLQFAVRDAVATSKPCNTAAGHSNKRLQSVVSTSTGDSFHGECPQKIRSEVGLRSAMSVAIKAVAEAVKDVSKVKAPRNVFDRLGRDADVSSTINHLEEYRGAAEDVVGGAFSDEREGIHLTYQHQNDMHMQHEDDMTSLNDNIVLSSDFGYDAGEYDDDDDDDATGQRITHAYQLTSCGGGRVDDSLKFQYDMNDGSDERRLTHRRFDRVAHVPGASFRVASSIIMNFQKPQNQDASMMLDSDTNAVKSQASSIKEKSNPKIVLNGNARPDTELQHEARKTETPAGPYSTTLPIEDADSRTIFVSNVHFAATKDGLSRHFNKFGEVIKVIILTDPVTGQPKGSACIEFMRKAAAEQAFSLDGTSFMSRILKIVRKSSAQPETTSSTMLARMARASSFTLPRPCRAPFGRGFPGLYRSRIPIKPGPRSFQWKREMLASAMEASGQASSIVGSQHHTRSLTYIRIEAKAQSKVNKSSGTTA